MEDRQLCELCGDETGKTVQSTGWHKRNGEKIKPYWRKKVGEDIFVCNTCHNEQDVDTKFIKEYGMTYLQWYQRQTQDNEYFEKYGVGFTEYWDNYFKEKYNVTAKEFEKLKATSTTELTDPQLKLEQAHIKSDGFGLYKLKDEQHLAYFGLHLVQYEELKNSDMFKEMEPIVFRKYLYEKHCE